MPQILDCESDRLFSSPGENSIKLNEEVPENGLVNISSSSDQSTNLDKMTMTTQSVSVNKLKIFLRKIFSCCTLLILWWVSISIFFCVTREERSLCTWVLLNQIVQFRPYKTLWHSSELNNAASFNQINV